MNNSNWGISEFHKRGATLEIQAINDARRRKHCNHRKGGFIEILDGKPVLPEIGDSDKYAVLKHQFGWGDTWIICLRCGKKWKPGMPDYGDALNFPTDNTTSTSVQVGKVVRIIDQTARELTKES